MYALSYLCYKRAVNFYKSLFEFILSILKLFFPALKNENIVY